MGIRTLTQIFLINHESCVVTAVESLIIQAGLMAILNKGWRRTLMKCMHVANEVKGRRCARLYWSVLQKINVGTERQVPGYQELGGRLEELLFLIFLP